VSTDEAEVGAKKALVLTEAERLQRREESARRRKRQMEQKLQDEQVCLSSSSWVSILSFAFNRIPLLAWTRWLIRVLRSYHLTALNLDWVEMYMVGAKGPRAYGTVPDSWNHTSPFWTYYILLNHPSFFCPLDSLDSFTALFQPHSFHLQLFPRFHSHSHSHFVIMLVHDSLTTRIKL